MATPPSKYTHRFWTEHLSTSFDGTVREYAAPSVYTDLTVARKKHQEAKKGLWMREGWTDGHVSALKTWRNTQELHEEHQPKADIPPHLGEDRKYGRA